MMPPPLSQLARHPPFLVLHHPSARHRSQTRGQDPGEIKPRANFPPLPSSAVAVKTGSAPAPGHRTPLRPGTGPGPGPGLCFCHVLSSWPLLNPPSSACPAVCPSCWHDLARPWGALEIDPWPAWPVFLEQQRTSPHIPPLARTSSGIPSMDSAP